jgi:CHAT domain-containing protein
LPEEKATKESVKKILTEVSSAHLATHGFAAGTATGNGDDSGTGNSGTRAVAFSERPGFSTRLVAAKNPLSDCGIYLAPPPGARASADEAPNVLTADEIIGLDLGKCDIITLSACQTGLGRELNGQGVIGLRSAMVGAGAKSVLMSLWNVPDEATQILMKQFYINLWEKKMGKQEALADAQNFIRNQPKWKEPVNWAAWVLVGE